MAVSLLSMLIVLEAAWAGSVPCNATSIDVAAYDTEHSGTVVIEGCQWRQSAITLLFSQAATVVVQHVTLEGGTFTAVGSATSGRFPSGSRLTIINSSATGCVDCFSVNADVLVDFSLVVVGSTLRGTHTAASIHSTNATDCTISITHSSVSTTATGETDALSACVWGLSPLVATRLQLSSEYSSIGSTSSAAMACSLGIVSHYGAVTLRTVDVTVAFSDVASSAMWLQGSYSAAASVGFATSTNPISATNVVMQAANSNIISVANCMVYTPAAAFGFASVGLITVENSSMLALNCRIASTANATMRGGMAAAASLGFASFSAVKVTSSQVAVSSSTIDAEASSTGTQAGYAQAASGAAASVNPVNVVNMQLSSSKSAVTARVKCLAGYGAAGALGLASYPNPVIASNISILVSSSNVSATSSAGTNCVVAASGIAGKAISIADCVIYAKDSNVSSEALVSSTEAFASSMSCVAFAALSAINVLMYSLSSTISANARSDETRVAAATMGFATLNEVVSVSNITVYAFASTTSAVANGQSYIAAASVGVVGLSALESNDTVFYAVNSTHVVIATATAPTAVYASAAVVGLASVSLVRCNRAILYVVQCNCTSEASALGQHASAATVGLASATYVVLADDVEAVAIQSTVSARAYSTDRDAAAAAGAATTSVLSGSSISIHVIRSNVTATASSSSSCAGGAGVAAWNPPDKLSTPTIISVCQSSVTALTHAGRATAASYAQRLVVLDSRMQSKSCLFCDAPPSNTTLCNLDVSQCAAMGWSLKGNASGSANTILNNSVMASKEVHSSFPGLAVADQCAMPLSDCPSVAAPSVVVPVVDFPLFPIPAIVVETSTLSEPTSRSSTHSAPVTRSASTATRRSLSLGPASHSLPLPHTSTPTPSLSRQLGRATPVSSAQIAVLSSVVPESSARAVVASGVAASAVVGVFASPGAAVAATRIGMVLSSVDCRFNDDDTSPSLLQYPLTVGEGLPAHAIGVASACGLVLLAVGLGAVVSLGGHSAGMSRLLVLVRSVEAVLHQYCGPSMVSGAVLVARHSDSLAAVLSCCVCVCCEACVLLHRGRVVVWRVPREVQCERGPEGGRGTIKTRWVGELAEQYGAFFDMCRSERLAVRVCFFVELCGSLLLGCVAGWRPTSGSCSGVAALMLVVATALFLYEVVLLPYRCVRDNAFGVIMGALQVAQCVCALLLTLDWMTSKVLLGWMALCQSCSLIAQLCLTLAWVSVLRARRQSAAALDSTPLPRTSLLDVPLQPQPPSASHNPLASNESVATLSSL